jgi:pSer/pThr/pTyr-binding forkhead associated (FHA) protein
MTSGQFRGPRTDPPPDDETISRYWIRVGPKEIQLGSGETLIGRSQECAVVVTEGLVSRRHARIVLEGGRPYIEDLGSANGTFVNLQRLEGRAVLFPGDLVFIGMAELEIVRRAGQDELAAAPIHAPRMVEEDRPTPVSGVGAFAPPSSRRGALSSSHTSSSSRQRAVIAIDLTPPTASTSEIEGLEYVGRLADKMLTMGRIDGAVKILKGHLDDVLLGARSGIAVDHKLVDTAGRYAIKLASETLDARWVDLAIELHVITCRPLRDETLRALESLRRKGNIGNDHLILRYHERLLSRIASMSPADRELSERVATLIPGLGGSR